MAGLASLHAQEWEQVGWQGGNILIEAQLGNTLYGIGGNNFSNDGTMNEIYRSTDFGKTWKIFRNGLPLCTYGVEIKKGGDYVYLALDPNRDVISAVDGIGVYVATENDTTWTHLPFTPIAGNSPFARISDGFDPLLLFNDKNILSLYPGIVGQNDTATGYYLSTNKGTSWVRTLKEVPHIVGIESHCILHRIYAFVNSCDSVWQNPRRLLYTSNDEGKTWEQLFYPIPDSLEGTPYFLNDSLIFVFSRARQNSSYGNKIYRSIDAGRNWLLLNVPIVDSTIDWSGLYSCYLFGSKIYITAAGKKTVQLTSGNNGISWEKFTWPDSGGYLEGKSFPIGNNFIVRRGSFDQYIIDTTLNKIKPYRNYTGLKSTDGVLLFVNGDTLFSTHSTDYYSYHYSDSVRISTDNGITWIDKIFSNGDLTGKPHWVKTGSKLYAAGREKNTFNSCIFLSTNEGSSWNKLPPLPTTLEILQLFASNDTVIVILSEPQLDTSQLFYNIAGNGWKILPLPNTNWFRWFFLQSSVVEFHNGSIYIVNTNFDFFESSNLGANWTNKSITSYTQGDYPPWQLFFLGNKILISTHYAGSPIIYKSQLLISNDEALSFTLDSNLAYDSIPLYPTVVDHGILFASGELPSQRAVLYSMDSGWNWQQIPGNIPDCPDLFVGSKYYFMAGRTELWRFPKSAFSSVPNKKASKAPTLSLSCFPNPTATSTHISYSLPQHSEVLIESFDIMGRSVARIASGAQDAGAYEAVWDTNLLPAGSYIIRLTANGESVSKVVEVVR